MSFETRFRALARAPLAASPSSLIPSFLRELPFITQYE